MGVKNKQTKKTTKNNNKNNNNKNIYIKNVANS